MRQVLELDRTIKLINSQDLIVLEEQMAILSSDIHKRFGKCNIQRIAVVMAATTTRLMHFAASW